MITVAVEGDTDVPFVARLCKESGFAVNLPIVAGGGKAGLGPYIRGFARAGRGSPHLVVRDLDQDAACAGAWLEKERPATARYFLLRLAVRAVEAWFLADTETAARSLAVPRNRVPPRPDDEVDPKLSIVQLARRSTKPAIRNAIVPPPGWSRKVGPGYASWLLSASGDWDFAAAVARSPSLARAHRALASMFESWREQTS